MTTAEKPEPVGYFDLVVKAYPSGKMSKHLGELQASELQCSPRIAPLLLSRIRLALDQMFQASVNLIMCRTQRRFRSSLAQVGDELDVKGPIPKFPYKPNMKKSIGEPPHRSSVCASVLMTPVSRFSATFIVFRFAQA